MSNNKEADALLKARLRGAALRVRAGIAPEEKHAADREIFRRVTAMPEYAAARLLLCYVSVRSEPDTAGLIEAALRSGKVVAVPRCGPAGNSMAFYRIFSLDNLRPGSFGIPQPEPGPEGPVDPRGGLCIVPGLRFDARGARLGYGKGYYDRFLSGFDGVSAGICYDRLFAEEPLPREEHDVASDFVVTERRIVRL